jgi:hypothetical protein
LAQQRGSCPALSKRGFKHHWQVFISSQSFTTTTDAIGQTLLLALEKDKGKMVAISAAALPT